MVYVFFQVVKWPKCRDSSISGCDVSSSNPKLPANDLTVSNLGTTIAFGEKISVTCKELGKITDAFVELKLVSLHCFWIFERRMNFNENLSLYSNYFRLANTTESFRSQP